MEQGEDVLNCASQQILVIGNFSFPHKIPATCTRRANKTRTQMDHSPIRQTFIFENNFSTVGKSVLNLVKLSSLVAKYCKLSKT